MYFDKHVYGKENSESLVYGKCGNFGNSDFDLIGRNVAEYGKIIEKKFCRDTRTEILSCCRDTGTEILSCSYVNHGAE